MLPCASSPHARKGALWSAYSKHFGKDNDEILVWQASTRDMNASVRQSYIDMHVAEDPSRASAEYMAQFRTDIEGFVAREAVEACVEVGLRERPPAKGVYYSSFTDPSGGSSDSMVCVVGHMDGDLLLVDAVREIRSPFDPESAVAEIAQLLALYDYGDEDGVLLSQTVRYAPKTFRRRRPDGKGGWVWSTKGIREVPYRLKDVRSALVQVSPIAIVEGEKNADALWRIGVPATTNACGAKNTDGWRADLRVHFQGADIILVPENDDAGYGFINDVGAALAGTAKRIRVLMLPGLTKKGGVFLGGVLLGGGDRRVRCGIVDTKGGKRD
jgi:hypothetical protein